MIYAPPGAQLKTKVPPSLFMSNRFSLSSVFGWIASFTSKSTMSEDKGAEWEPNTVFKHRYANPKRIRAILQKDLGMDPDKIKLRVG